MSRRSSYAGSFAESSSPTHERAHSNSSAYSLATSLALSAATPASAKAAHHGKTGLLSKLKHVRLGSAKRDSALWEWKCKGDDMENFDWPSWEEQHSPEVDMEGTHNPARDSSGSQGSSSSALTWSSEQHTDDSMISSVGNDKRTSQRLQDEQAAIDALESFFAQRRVSHTYVAAVIAIDEVELGIDLSAYDEEAEETYFRPTTFIEAPPTPVVARKPVPIPRESFMSLDSDDSRSSIATDFAVGVIDHQAKRVLRSSRGRRLPAKIDTKAISAPVAVETITSAPAFMQDPMPVSPSPRKRRPSSALIIGLNTVSPLDKVAVMATSAFTATEMQAMKAQCERPLNAYQWI